MKRMTRSMILPAIVLFLAAASVRSQVPANTCSNVTQAQAQAALDFHNAKRHEVGAPPLLWSATLAAAAQNWANHLAVTNHCGLIHTVNDQYGENLFGGSGMPYTALNASQAWYNEISSFHYGPITPSNWAPSGHYTQMVWSHTTTVGIGQANCPGGATVIVAEYDPPGNYMGQKPY